MKTLVLSAAAISLVLAGCRGNGDPAPAPPMEAPSGESYRLPGPGNLLNTPEREQLYKDLDNYTQRYMAARGQGNRSTWKSLHRSIVGPMVDKNLDELIRTARSPGDRVFRVISARGLGFGADEDRIGPVLVELLANREPNLISSALVSLYLLASPNTPLSPLVAHLNHEDPDVRSMCALALFAVLRARRGEGRVPPTAEVEEASGRLVLLVSNLEEDPFVRGHAAAALGAIGDPAVTDILINLLNDGASVVRTRAAEGLGQMGQEQAILPLIDALGLAKVPNEAIVMCAALEKIAQIRKLYCDAKALGRDSERWRDWYLAIRE